MKDFKYYNEEWNTFNMKKGDWILYNNKRKKCFGIHSNGNVIIKMNGNLVQVHYDNVKKV